MEIAPPVAILFPLCTKEMVVEKGMARLGRKMKKGVLVCHPPHSTNENVNEWSRILGDHLA